LLFAGSLHIEITHHLDANVSFQRITGVAFRLVLHRTSFEYAAIRSNEKVIWKVRPICIARRGFKLWAILPPILHMTYKLERAGAFLPDLACMVDGDPDWNLFAFRRNGICLRAPLLASDNIRFCY
jgi:hypothetical protein